MVRFCLNMVALCCSLLLFTTACSKKNAPENSRQKSDEQTQHVVLSADNQVDVTLGAGPEGDIYFKTGQELISLLKACVPEVLNECSVVQTEGSVDNINRVLSGTCLFGLAQSDQQYEAVQGLSVWDDAGPQEKLRALFSVYPETVTIISRAEAGIQSARDLRGRKVNLGELGSGSYQNALDVLQSLGIDPDSDLDASTLSLKEVQEQLLDDMLDAFFLTTGHPSAVLQDLLDKGVRIRLVPIEPIAPILAQKPYYLRKVIPLEMYPDLVNSQDVVTLGVQATLVTSADLPDQLAYAMAKGFIDNLETFKNLDPAYKSLTYASALQALSAPLHPGAIKYYTEIAPYILEKTHKNIVGR